MKKPKGLYVHIPFCIKKCKYCDFISFCGCDEKFDLYINKLLEEAKEYKNEKIDTIFIGGGTPTILSPELLDKLILGLRRNFDISNDSEFSIEANPKTLTKEKLLILKKNGVNRLSIGVQSFSDDELTSIGRIHDAKSAYNTVCMAKDCGFSNINLDIMLSLPNQTEKTLINTLKTAVKLEPTHISCYSLILEEGTVLFREYESGKYLYPDDEKDRGLYHMAVDFLRDNGYKRYEISNFSKEGFSSGHNLKYWNCDEYIGLGISAHSYIDGIRKYNVSSLEDYLKGNFHDGNILTLSEKDKISEYIIMRLRLSDGISEDDFYERFGIKITDIFPDEIKKLTDSGLLIYDKERYFLSDYGIDISNSVMCEFV